PWARQKYSWTSAPTPKSSPPPNCARPWPARQPRPPPATPPTPNTGCPRPSPGRPAGCQSRHMQDRYAGDLGDFLKFGLLRWLAPPDSPWPRLGVIWYGPPAEPHTATANPTPYPPPTPRSAGRLRQLAPDLYERLARLVSTDQRSTAALASAGLLGAQTRFFGDLLDLADLPV